MYDTKGNMPCNLYVKLTVNNMHVDAGPLRYGGHATVIPRVA